MSHTQPQQPNTSENSPHSPCCNRHKGSGQLQLPPSGLALPGWAAALPHRHETFDVLCNFLIGSSVHGIKPWHCFRVTCWVTCLHIRKHTGNCHSYIQAFWKGWKLPFCKLSPAKITEQVTPSRSDQFKLSLDSAKLVKGSPWESSAWWAQDAALQKPTHNYWHHSNNLLIFLKDKRQLNSALYIKLLSLSQGQFFGSWFNFC